MSKNEKMALKFVSNFEVVENIRLNSTTSLIKLVTDSELPDIKPGQFVNIEINDAPGIFLRRPFSIFEVDHPNRVLSLIVKVLGRGSEKLTHVAQGVTISVVYPLGNHFTMPQQEDRILLVGGGSGLAPMLFLAKKSGLPAHQVDIIIGARSKADHVNMEHYGKYGKLHYTTEDGSWGEKGYVTQHSLFVKNLREYDRIYACGPDGMMRAIAKEAKKVGIFCEVSLENLMACGFGVCLCCIEPTREGNKCVCTDGPVFNINELTWQI